MKFIMKIECILFAFEGILYSSENSKPKAVQKVAKSMISYGLNAGRKELSEDLMQLPDLSEESLTAVCRTYAERAGQQTAAVDPFVVGAAITAYHKSLQKSRQRLAGVRKVLGQLSKYDLGVLAHSSPVDLSMALIELNIGSSFRDEKDEPLLFCSQKPEQARPKPYLWNLAQASLGFVYQQSITVCHDVWGDVFGARSLGMITVMIGDRKVIKENCQEAREQAKAYSAARQKKIKKEDWKALLDPDYIIDSFNDLPRLVERIEKHHKFASFGKKKS